MYAATAAPGVTFWDAGEFIASVETLGIPHPPGTPLYVLLARAWRLALPMLPAAPAVNLFSAAATAAAGGIAAALVWRWTGLRAGALAGAVMAGTMSSVWASATEAEVYASSLLLAMLMLAAADRAARGANDRVRWLALAAYCGGFALPLHLSALVAAPAAALLVLHPLAGDAPERRWRPRDAGLAAAAAVIGASVLLVLLVRARHDPGINQGDPATWSALADVVTRRQYDVAPIWPRQAPWWIQLGNLFEYADWQVALSLAPGVAPSWRRTPFTIVVALLGVAGALAHRRLDRRSWRVLLVLFLSASVGIAAYVNFKAGPSFGHGILAADAPHEARERDYFFALAFWVWGLWAGLGVSVLAAEVARRWRGPVFALAALPLVLNWRAMDRRREPEASLPRAVAWALLESAPPRAVLFVAGDNDTYPLWYLQQVEGLRRDVVVVTLPLLGAPWYRRELARRWSLADSAAAAQWRGERWMVAHVAGRAHAAGRPVAVAATVEAGRRAAASGEAGRLDGWKLRGVVYLQDPGGGDVDRPATARIARGVAAYVEPPLSREALDPTARWMQDVLRCAAHGMAEPPDEARRLLDSSCNRK